MKIVVPDLIWGIPEKYWDELRNIGAEVYTDRPDRQEIISRVKDAQIITVNYYSGDKDLIDSAPQLKHIIAPAVGYDWIDIDYAATKGISVSNCPTFVPLTVAEHAMALLLSLAKNLNIAQADMRSGIWQPNNYTGLELAGKKLGLLGYGHIGKNIERMASGFGMSVSHTNSKSSAEDIDKIFADSDVVCLCLPLTNETRHMVDARRLGMLKKSAYLINVARGPIIDQSALVEALKRNDFAGAGLDVYDGEPGATGQISEQIQQLVSLPNVVATPHSAFNTHEALDRKGAEIVANIKACLDGQPINVVNG